MLGIACWQLFAASTSPSPVVCLPGLEGQEGIKFFQEKLRVVSVQLLQVGRIHANPCQRLVANFDSLDIDRVCHTARRTTSSHKAEGGAGAAGRQEVRQRQGSSPETALTRPPASSSILGKSMARLAGTRRRQAARQRAYSGSTGSGQPHAQSISATVMQLSAQKHPVAVEAVHDWDVTWVMALACRVLRRQAVAASGTAN